MKNVNAYLRPETLTEACEFIGEDGAVVLAGATTLSLSKDPAITSLVDLADIEELKTIDVRDGKIILGSMVTMSDIYFSDLIDLKSLKAAARAVSSTPIRNVVTVGGEIARGVYWTDFPVLLLALDAKVELLSKEFKRVVPLKDIYKSHPSKFINKNEIITQITIDDNKNSHFVKFAKTNVDYAIVNSGASLKLNENGVIEASSVVIGAVVPLATHLVELDEILFGERPSEELFELAAAKAVDVANLRSDFRVSSEYQKQLIKTLVKRSLMEAVNLTTQERR